MKKMIVLLLALVIAGSAFSQPIDPDPNMLGMYMDAEATIVQGPVPVVGYPVENYFTYLVLTNPTYAQIGGVDFGYDVVGGGFIVQGLPQWATDTVALGSNTNEHGEWAAGFGTPIPGSPATLLATFEVMPYGGACDIIVTSNPNSATLWSPDLPKILDENGDIAAVGLSAGIGGVCLSIGTATVVVPNEATSLDAVKSLYR